MKLDRTTIENWVSHAINQTQVYDLHTHVYPARFDKLLLWGIDELLNYHYLTAETLRAISMPYDTYWGLSREARSDLVWKTLFVDRAPISEACRGVLTVLSRLGLDLSRPNLKDYRGFFSSMTSSQYIDLVFKTANVHTVVMTNDLFDPIERNYWLNGGNDDPRFQAVLRIDPLLMGGSKLVESLSALGYSVNEQLDENSLKEIRRFLTENVKRLKAKYVAVSLTPDWRYPDNTPATRVIDQCILPVAREHNLPFAVMIGVRRQVNPALRLAGDAVGKSDIESLDQLCANNPKNKFMVTMLSRENQHELAVSARKQPNLFLFGCWWFLNNPVIIEEMTRMRMELLGESFVPQHSDSRVLDQLIYKWDHSRSIIAKVLTDKFVDLAATGWTVTQDQVTRTAAGYMSENFRQFIESPAR